MSSLIIDSSFASLAEALQGTTAPQEVRATLALIDVTYFSFDGQLHKGQMVIKKELSDEVLEIFGTLLMMRFPIAKAVPMVTYGWDDEAAMADNNCSAFNYRLILGTDRLSNHSFGRAIDINPMQNPYYARDGKAHPTLSTYNPNVPGTLVKGSEALALFKNKGWMWGGDWTVPIDYQHLEKPLT
jgi:peptidoglycan LD-endopeptidase CwlK